MKAHFRVNNKKVGIMVERKFGICLYYVKYGKYDLRVKSRYFYFVPKERREIIKLYSNVFPNQARITMKRFMLLDHPIIPAYWVA